MKTNESKCDFENDATALHSFSENNGLKTSDNLPTLHTA